MCQPPSARTSCPRTGGCWRLSVPALCGLVWLYISLCFIAAPLFLSVYRVPSLVEFFGRAAAVCCVLIGCCPRCRTEACPLSSGDVLPLPPISPAVQPHVVLLSVSSVLQRWEGACSPSFMSVYVVCAWGRFPAPRINACRCVVCPQTSCLPVPASRALGLSLLALRWVRWTPPVVLRSTPSTRWHPFLSVCVRVGAPVIAPSSHDTSCFVLFCFVFRSVLRGCPRLRGRFGIWSWRR